MQPAAPTALALYRADAAGERGMIGAVRPHLEAAGEALHLLLALDSETSGEDSEAALQARATQARAFLVEAVIALGTARVCIPSIRTYSLAVVMATEPDIHAELTRLHQLATRLLWYNIQLLPARRRAAPLAPEDEAQLARVLDGLARTAKIDRVLDYGWMPLLAVLALLGPLHGAPLFGVVVAGFATVIAAWKLARMQRATAPVRV
ncbi:MAG: hypothetical protein R3A79_23500 [Nannocystaceae bacterium]